MNSQNTTKTAEPPPRLRLPQAPHLVLEGNRIFCLTQEGEFTYLAQNEAKQLALSAMPLVCNAPHWAARLGVDRLHAYDVLELFAFVHPGVFIAPSVRGITRHLNLFDPATTEDECMALRDIARHLLLEASMKGEAERRQMAGLAAMMAGNHGSAAGWGWSEPLLHALGWSDPRPGPREIRAALQVWERLPEWSVHAPEPLHSHKGVSTEEVLTRLHTLLGKQKKEDRTEQRDYAAFVARAFDPMQEPDAPNVLLAEAGTGVGKTLGYLSPATVWAEKNGGTVWVSTYTRNLQRQIDSELQNLYPDPVEKSRKVVTRKGRENYLCLLNLEDLAHSPALSANDRNTVALGLIVRWVLVTEDGDLAGKDFPGWLGGLLGWQRLASFADRRGECIYSACPHFDKCFIEKSVRKARRADVVIANHALVMHQTASNGEDNRLPSHYVFDEGHHVFEAADSAFSLDLNGREAADLRRWILGVDGGRRGRARGLKRRMEEVLDGNDQAMEHLQMLLDAAHSLPATQWRQRLSEGNPKGVAEVFLQVCYQQVVARNANDEGFFSIETEVTPPVDGLAEAAYAFRLRLNDMRTPMLALVRHLEKRLEDEADDLNTAMRERMMFVINSLRYRAEVLVGGWISLLESITKPAPEHMVDWLEVTRIEGRDTDVGIYRRYVDPAEVFFRTLKPYVQGMVLTSASLRDVSAADEEGWGYALKRSGMEAQSAPQLFSVPSPFRYENQTKIFVVTDVDKKNPAQVAAAYRELFLASGGGALGLFTSIQRLKSAYGAMVNRMEEAGLRLYSQHIDPLDIASLIDMFREEENACLLGTDATRDGIDVPGKSLRLVVYDRVPWPKPNILHKARRKYFGSGYDDMLTRFKLKQAYGRLVRRADDRGVFVMLDSAMPSRLLSVFPQGVEIERIGLKEAIEKTKAFLG